MRRSFLHSRFLVWSGGPSTVLSHPPVAITRKIRDTNSFRCPNMGYCQCDSKPSSSLNGESADSPPATLPYTQCAAESRGTLYEPSLEIDAIRGARVIDQSLHPPQKSSIQLIFGPYSAIVPPTESYEQDLSIQCHSNTHFVVRTAPGAEIHRPCTLHTRQFVIRHSIPDQSG
ncbi:hypothetical protein C8R47DRAFT_1108804 [Mycena vitilis]|nr:hypothetical protein C8R47DRAFT_1108804 [Mycena vitilis]